MNETDEAQQSFPLRVGDILAAERRRQGLKIEAIAQQSRIPLRHLKSIEASDLDALPATTYSAGFIKTYARILGLDAAALTAEFRAERGGSTVTPTSQPESLEPADPRRVPPRTLSALALAIALLFAIAWFTVRGFGDIHSRQELAASGDVPPASTPAQPAKATASSAIAQPPSDTDPVTLSAPTEDVWLRVSDGEALVWMGTLKAGESYSVPTNAVDPRLQTGRPNSLAAMIGSRRIDALDRELRTVKDVPLKGAQLFSYVSSITRSAPRNAPAPNSAPAPDGDVATSTRP